MLYFLPSETLISTNTVFADPWQYLKSCYVMLCVFLKNSNIHAAVEFIYLVAKCIATIKMLRKLLISYFSSTSLINSIIHEHWYYNHYFIIFFCQASKPQNEKHDTGARYKKMSISELQSRIPGVSEYHIYPEYSRFSKISYTSCLPKRLSQTVQTQIRLLLKKQSGQGSLYFLFWLAFF